MKKALSFALCWLCILTALSACGRRVVQEPEISAAVTAESEETAVTAEPEETAVSPEPAGAAAIPASAVYFFDDFQDGDTAGWSITAGWDVQQDGDVYCLQTAVKGATYVPGGLGWESGYALRATYQLDAGVFGFSFNATLDGRYVVRIDSATISLIKEDADGSAMLLAEAPAPTAGQPHYIAMGSQGEVLQVYVDQALILYTDDPGAIPGGTIMVGAADGAQVWVDNVLVHELLGRLVNPAGEIPEPEPVEPEDMGMDIEELPSQDEEVEEIPDSNIHVDIPDPQVNFGISSQTDPGPDSVTVNAGEDVLMTWVVTDAAAVYFDGDLVASDGEMFVTVNGTTEFTLTVVALDGTSAEHTVTVNVVQAAAVGPDLVLVSASGGAVPFSEREVSFWIVVRNDGDTVSGAFTLRWYAHTNGGVTKSFDVGPLAPGEEYENGFSYTYDNKGTMHWRAVVDEDNEVQEASESNNTVTGTVDLQ